MTEFATVRLGRFFCFIGAGVGALGILAWLFRVERVLTVFPRLPPMMPNSAFALLLLGIAGSLVLQGRAGRLERLMVTSSTILVFVVSIGTVVEYALGTDLFLDQLIGFRREPYNTSYSSPSASAAFALLAAG